MSDVGQIERMAQDRVVKLFEDNLGYEYLGNWEYREGNSNIEVELLVKNLRSRGYDDNLINKAVDKVKKDASLGGGRDLYEANRDVYELLRYGVKVKPGVGEQFETVWLIDWSKPKANDFAVAEEVTVLGEHTKRPDVVLYVNGIALVTLELKRSMVAVSEGIRQTIGNQKPEFIRPFYTTVQLAMAGNDVEGLRYGVIDTPEKYWLEWKEPSDIEDPLDRALTQLCSQPRLLELIHDFMVFDAGVIERFIRGQAERALAPEDLLLWQDQLYELRRESPQIPNLVYKRTRERNEQAMNKAAAELADAALSRSAGGGTSSGGP
jgi:type I restriction enzyme, R subunit